MTLQWLLYRVSSLGRVRGKVSIDGRPHEVDAVFDARLDKDADIFQEVRPSTTGHMYNQSLANGFDTQIFLSCLFFRDAVRWSM